MSKLVSAHQTQSVDAGARVTGLGISRILIKYIIGEFACNGVPRDDEAVDVEGVDDKWATGSVLEQLRHAVKVDQ